MQKFLVTASVLALMAAPAFAQDPDPKTPPPPAAQDEQVSPPPAAVPDVKTDELKTDELKTDDANVDKSASTSGEWRGSKLMGQIVRNGANESIGDINDLIIDNSGKVTAVIVGVGGFLGMGEKAVALPFDQLSISRDTNNSLVVMANTTKESLEAMPEWKDPTKSSTMSTDR